MAGVDLLVHRNTLIGTPAVVSSTFSRSPPASRIHPSPASTSFLPLLNSPTALVMVVRDIPFNCDNRVKPPRPQSNALSATSATYNRA
jgi:hypothetical protein